MGSLPTKALSVKVREDHRSSTQPLENADNRPYLGFASLGQLMMLTHS